MFPTKYNFYESRKTVFSNTGSPERAKYKYQYDENGVKELLPDGTYEPIQEMIESYADSCDINVLMKRFSLGDVNVLDQVRGFYADVRDFPTSYADLFQRLEDCQRMFNSLKPEVREEFNNSVSEFFSTYGSDEFIKKLNKFSPDYVAEDNGNVKEEKGAAVNEF